MIEIELGNIHVTLYVDMYVYRVVLLLSLQSTLQINFPVGFAFKKGSRTVVPPR